MTDQLNSNQIESVERVASIALIVGGLAVFQGGYQVLYQIGLFLLALGVVATLISQIIKREIWLRVIEQLVILGMMMGILGMLQPWNIWLYENGFYVLGICTLAFIIVLHIPVNDNNE